MKKNKLPNFLKLGVLLFGVSLLLWNCEKGKFLSEENVLQYKSPIESMEIVSLNDINPTIKNTVINSESDFARKSKKYISYSFNDIIKIVDTLQNTKFSIRFKLNNQPENIIYNLITGTRNDNSTIVPYVMKYTISNLSEMTNNDGSLDFLKFKGTVGKYGYIDILKSLGKKHKSNNGVGPEPICSEQTFSGRIGSYGGINNDRNIDRNNYGGRRSSSSYSRGGANSHFTTYSSNKKGSTITGFTVGDGTITTDDGEEVNCNNRPRWNKSSSGGEVQRAPDPNDPQATGAPDKDCDKDGEAPINSNVNPPSCKSFNFINTTSTWQSAAVKNIGFKVIKSNLNGAYIHLEIKFSQPILFEMPSNMIKGGDISSGLAAELSAKALQVTISETHSHFRDLTIFTNTEVEIYFKDRLRYNYPIMTNGGRVNFNSMTSNLTPTEYQTNWFDIGDCD